MQATTTNELTTFVDLIGYEDTYQISTEWSYDIRKKLTNSILKQSTNKDGYTQVELDGYYTRLDILIAVQFLYNDDPLHKTEVLHMNSIRLDNHLDNLFWITRNKFFNIKTLEEPECIIGLTIDDCLRIVNYKNFTFDKYYYWKGYVLERIINIPDMFLIVDLKKNKKLKSSTIELFSTSIHDFITIEWVNFITKIELQQPNGIILKRH